MKLFFHLLLSRPQLCLLYTSDAADDLLCVDLGGRRIIKKKKHLTRLCVYTLATRSTPLYADHHDLLSVHVYM